jgi:hypothetical protein
MAWLKAGQQMLRISVHEDDKTIEITFEGRIAGPWAEEVSRVWVEMAPRVGIRSLCLDLRNVTYSDAAGKLALRDIYARTHARLMTGTPWTQYLAEEISKPEEDRPEEAGHGNHA